MTRVLLALKYFISISGEGQPYALGVFHDITILVGYYLGALCTEVLHFDI